MTNHPQKVGIIINEFSDFAVILKIMNMRKSANTF